MTPCAGCRRPSVELQGKNSDATILPDAAKGLIGSDIAKVGGLLWEAELPLLSTTSTARCKPHC